MQIEALSTVEEQSTAARSGLYRLLVQAFSFPDRAFFASLVSGGFRREVEAACQELPFQLGLPLDGLAADGEYLDFQAEFLRIFEVGVGSPPCPLYSGLYRGGRRAVMEELTRFYNYFGLSLERGSGELPDHLTTELEFMHFLAFKQLWALHEGHDSSPYLRAQVDFLERQILQWLPSLQARLESVNPPRFYGDLVATAVAFAAADAGYLRDTLGAGSEVFPVQTVTQRVAGGE